MLQVLFGLCFVVMRTARILSQVAFGFCCCQGVYKYSPCGPKTAEGQRKPVTMLSQRVLTECRIWCALLRRREMPRPEMHGKQLLLNQQFWPNMSLFNQKRGPHTKPHQVSLGMKNRAVNRPAQSFQSPTGRRRGQQENFLTSPSSPESSPSRERNPKFTPWRAKLKASKSPKELMSHLHQACKKSQVDQSVFGAAMQSCKARNWWETLLEVHDLRCQNNDLKMGFMESCIFIDALSSCLKSSKSNYKSEAALSAKQRQALTLAKQVWHNLPPPLNETNVQAAQCSAWKLCLAIGPLAFPWGMEVLAWSKTTKYSKNIFSYSALLAFFEQNGRQQTVDEMLRQAFSVDKLTLNEVVLGSLINVAGAAHDWRRVENLWNMFRTSFGVIPNFLSFTARAKAHLLSGRPAFASQIFDEMESKGVRLDESRTIADRLQARLILCHADPTKSKLRELFKLIDNSHVAEGNASDRRQIQQLVKLAKQLKDDPLSLFFHDILVRDHARYGKMKNWPRYEAGSKYIKEEAL